jgi:hypothetical protein
MICNGTRSHSRHISCPLQPTITFSRSARFKCSARSSMPTRTRRPCRRRRCRSCTHRPLGDRTRAALPRRRRRSKTMPRCRACRTFFLVCLAISAPLPYFTPSYPSPPHRQPLVCPPGLGGRRPVWRRPRRHARRRAPPRCVRLEWILRPVRAALLSLGPRAARQVEHEKGHAESDVE